MGNISSADEQGPLVVREWNPELRSERARELDRCHPLVRRGVCACAGHMPVCG